MNPKKIKRLSITSGPYDQWNKFEVECISEGFKASQGDKLGFWTLSVVWYAYLSLDLTWLWS